MIESISSLLDKLGLARTFRYLTSGIAITVVLLVVNPNILLPTIYQQLPITGNNLPSTSQEIGRAAQVAPSTINDQANQETTKSGGAQLEPPITQTTHLDWKLLLLLIFGGGMVASHLMRNVLGRIFFYRLQEFYEICIHKLIVCGSPNPTILSYLKQNGKSCSSYRLEYHLWRRSTQATHAAQDDNSATSNTRAMESRAVIAALDLAHAEIDLLFLLGTTWIVAAYSLHDNSASREYHFLIGIVILLAGVLADWRQHKYEFMLWNRERSSN